MRGSFCCQVPFPSPGQCFGRPEAPGENWVRIVGAMPGWRWGGPIFVDGSASHAKFGSRRRAGWAAVQIDQAGRFAACMHGVVPRGWGPDQWARDGENDAFHMIAGFSEPPSGGKCRHSAHRLQ
eukprot:6311670-Pyramimonas_sp.AAC.1